MMKLRNLLLIAALFVVMACGMLEVDRDGGEDAPAEEQPEGADAGSGSEGGEAAAGIDSLMANYTDGPGGAVMVIQDGVIVFQNAYGFASLEAETPITTDTIFHLGSVGKQFTAMGIMILSERGLVDYDAPIGSYIPELAWMDDEVTVRRLLYHTSGIMGYDDSDEIYNTLVSASSAPGNEDLLAVLAEQGGMLSNPGEEYYYNNTGYDILGALIERISGQSYAVFMDENIFLPLGMVNTFALPNSERLNGGLVAESYYFEGEPLAYEPDVLDNINGSGSIYSNLGDLFLYDQALRTNELVSAETLTEAFTSGTLNNGESINYGFGWDVSEYNGEPYVGHSGAWLGFESYFLRFTDRDLSVVVLLNLDYSDGDGAEGIAFSAADLYLK